MNSPRMNLVHAALDTAYELISEAPASLLRNIEAEDLIKTMRKPIPLDTLYFCRVNPS
jgi:hypothetical protein